VVDKALVVDPEHQLDLDKMLAELQAVTQTQAPEAVEQDK
jgi:hypothetical protein